LQFAVMTTGFIRIEIQPFRIMNERHISFHELAPRLDSIFRMLLGSMSVRVSLPNTLFHRMDSHQCVHGNAIQSLVGNGDRLCMGLLHLYAVP